MKSKILYLDDEKTNLTAFKVCFNDTYDILLANNRNEALEQLNSNEVKVLITDQRMPDILGVDFIKEVNFVYPDTVCIILTAFPENDLLMKSINKVNVFRFLTKPWVEFDMAQTIKSAVEYYDIKKDKDNLYKSLLQALKKSEESDRLKSTFLTNLSHEIRTPLNGIMGFTSLLSSTTLSENQLNKYKTIINESGKRLMTIIEDILSASRIQIGEITLSKITFSLYELVKEVYESNRISAQDKGLSFSIKGINESNDKLITADKKMLADILNQLVKNAIKFTNSGSVEIGVEVNNSGQFYVKDTGIGIDKKNQEVIFEYFRQESEEELSRTHDGNGLGLFIAKGIIKAVEGKIWCESEKENLSDGKAGGSTFFFTFPYELVSNNQKQKIILIVDDEDIYYEYLNDILQGTNFKIVRAKNGKLAYEYCKSNHADLVVMDIVMPEMNGIDAAKLIKNKIPDLPIIAHSSYTRYQEESNMIFNDFLVKPTSKQLLLNSIKTHFKK